MNFQNLDEYYEYLENDTNFHFYDLNTYKYIAALRDKTKDENDKKLCSLELSFAHFPIEKGKQNPKDQSCINTFITKELFHDDFEYIKSRANRIQNPKHRAKYNHLLWLSPKKHLDFAKTAIESYLTLLKSVDDNSQSLSFGMYFKNLFTLSQNLNYKKDEIISFLISLLESDKLNEYTKYLLMEFIIENGKPINYSVKQTFFNYAKNRINHLSNKELESFLNLLVLLCQKLSISPSEFHEKLGDFHISQLENEKNKGFIALHYYTNALEEYKMANIKEKIEQTAVLLEQAKKAIDLKKVSLEINDEKLNKALNQWWDFTKNKTDDIIENWSAIKIYEYLILEPIFPKADVLKQEIRPASFDFISIMTFDINKNINKNKSGGLSPYLIHINIFTINHIWIVVSKGFKSGKISFDSLINYLKSDTWYGQNFTYLDNNQEEQGFNWIELLTPALKNFFIQIEIDLNTNNNNSQGYILAIDSLTLKFEGLLREFSRMIGAQTIEIKDNGTEERISFDKLLDNEKLKSIIPEDDIAFFKFLFTSNGMNLRNNVAHCFFTTKNYSLEVMLLLIVALLRLGNYKLELNEDE